MKKTILFCVALAGLTAMSSCGNKAATKLENAADSASYAPVSYTHLTLPTKRIV